jgi:hypothetical protein
MKIDCYCHEIKTVEIPVPSFYRQDTDLMTIFTGVIDEERTTVVTKSPVYTHIAHGSPEVCIHSETQIKNKITQAEFYAAVSEAADLICLELRPSEITTADVHTEAHEELKTRITY